MALIVSGSEPPVIIEGMFVKIQVICDYNSYKTMEISMFKFYSWKARG